MSCVKSLPICLSIKKTNNLIVVRRTLLWLSERESQCERSLPVILSWNIPRLPSLQIRFLAAVFLLFASADAALSQIENLASAEKPLYAESQIFALVIGQGNYGGFGNLDEAKRSAQLVARHFGRINQAGQNRHIQIVLPAEAGNRPDHDELKEKIQRFVSLTQQQIDPAKQAVVLVYFIGHGLADGLSRFVFLLPEAVYDAGPLPRDLVKLSERTIDIAWLGEQLSEISDKVILLIDSCRPHQNEDQQFLRYWGELFKQDTKGIKGVFDVLQLLSGTAGTFPVIFSSADGMPAESLEYANGNEAERLGPLAIRLDLLLKEVERRGESLTYNDFLARLQTPATLASGKQVRGFSKYQGSSNEADFLLISPKQSVLKLRSVPYKKESRTPTLPAGPPTSASSSEFISKLNQMPFAGLLDFACLNSSQRCFLLDDETLWQWTPPQGKRVALKKNLLFPQIGATANGRLYLYTTETHEISLVGGSGLNRVVAKDIYLGFFGQSVEPDSLLVVEEDATIGTEDKIHRLTGSKLELVASIDTTNIGDLVEWRRGTFFYTVPAQGEIYQFSNGSATRFCANLRQSDALTFNDQYLFCLDQTGSILYRIDWQGQVAETWLRTERPTPDGPLPRNLDVRGFRAATADALYWLEGSYLMQINLNRIRWSLR